MSVEFNEDYSGSRNLGNFGVSDPLEVKGITGLFIKTGIVKSRQQANVLMVILTVLIFIATFIIL